MTGYTQNVQEIGFDCNADVTGLKFAKIVNKTGESGAEKQGFIENNNVQGGIVVGVITEDQSEGRRATVYAFNEGARVPVNAGSALNVGAEVTSAADGDAEPASSGDFVVGICVKSAAAGGVAVFTPKTYIK